jgi:hypothetical protein
LSAVSLGEGERQAGKEEQEGKEDMEEGFTRVFMEIVEDALETLRDASEEANAARAGKTEAARPKWILVY